jgi:hypothetical protein
MSGRVEAAVHQLRRYRPGTEATLDRLAATVDVLEEALEHLRATSDMEYRVPSADVTADLHGHVARNRAFADVFDEAARRFERTQDARRLDLPRVFSTYPENFVGPVRRGARSGDGPGGHPDPWLVQRLADWSGRPPSLAVRKIEDAMRRQIGLVGVVPYVVEERQYRFFGDVEAPLSPLLTAGPALELQWTITALSDGTAVATLSVGEGAEVTLGAGPQLEILVGDERLSFDHHVEMAGSALSVESWTKRFASVAEAEAAMRHGRVGSVGLLVGRALGGLVPGLHTLTDHLSPSLAGMSGAARSATTVRATVSAEADVQVLVGGDQVGGSLATQSTVTFSSERDKEQAATTDVVSVSARVPAALLAATPFISSFSSASVAVTRDDASGTARTLTVRFAFDAEPDLRPSLGEGRPLQIGPSPGMEPPTGAAVHRYEVTVAVDLADPANADLARGLSTATDVPAARIDEDLRAVARVPGLDAQVLARSSVTVLEMAPEPVQGLAVIGLPIEAGVVTAGYRTVAAWQNTGDRFAAR